MGTNDVKHRAVEARVGRHHLSPIRIERVAGE